MALQADGCAGVGPEYVAFAEVPAERHQTSVSGLGHDLKFCGAAGSSLRAEAGAPGAATVISGGSAKGFDAALDDHCHVRGMHADREEGRLEGVAGEERARRGSAGSEPGSQRADGARISVAPGQNAEIAAAAGAVLLLFADAHDDSLIGELQVGQVEGDDVGAPEGRSKAEEQHGAIAQAVSCGGQGGRDRAELLDSERGLLPRLFAFDALRGAQQVP